LRRWGQPVSLASFWPWPSVACGRAGLHKAGVRRRVRRHSRLCSG
jgi:hypothetical protein